MDIGPPTERRETSRKRFSSLNATNNGAALGAFVRARDLCCFGKVVTDRADHRAPARVIRHARLSAAHQGGNCDARSRGGLVDVLVPFFEQQTGYQVKTGRVGTGAALALGARGEA